MRIPKQAYPNIILNPSANMIMSGGPVGPRASKEEFMHALGLVANHPPHENLYKAMRVCRQAALGCCCCRC